MTEFTTATLPNGLGSIDVGITLPEHLRDESKGDNYIYIYIYIHIHTQQNK